MAVVADALSELRRALDENSFSVGSSVMVISSKWAKSVLAGTFPCPVDSSDIADEHHLSLIRRTAMHKEDYECISHAVYHLCTSAFGVAEGKVPCFERKVIDGHDGHPFVDTKLHLCLVHRWDNEQQGWQKPVPVLVSRERKQNRNALRTVIDAFKDSPAPVALHAVRVWVTPCEHFPHTHRTWMGGPANGNANMVWPKVAQWHVSEGAQLEPVAGPDRVSDVYLEERVGKGPGGQVTGDSAEWPLGQFMPISGAHKARNTAQATHSFAEWRKTMAGIFLCDIFVRDSHWRGPVGRGEAHHDEPYVWAEGRLGPSPTGKLMKRRGYPSDTDVPCHSPESNTVQPPFTCVSAWRYTLRPGHLVCVRVQKADGQPIDAQRPVPTGAPTDVVLAWVSYFQFCANPPHLYFVMNRSSNRYLPAEGADTVEYESTTNAEHIVPWCPRLVEAYDCSKHALQRPPDIPELPAEEVLPCHGLQPLGPVHSDTRSWPLPPQSESEIERVVLPPAHVNSLAPPTGSSSASSPLPMTPPHGNESPLIPNRTQISAMGLGRGKGLMGLSKATASSALSPQATHGMTTRGRSLMYDEEEDGQSDGGQADGGGEQQGSAVVDREEQAARQSDRHYMSSYGSSYTGYDYHDGTGLSLQPGHRAMNGRNSIRPPGACGLNNLGNTCFMNSTLQCLAASQPFTEYFLSKEYIRTINRENPLGSRGAIAHAWGALIRAMYSGCFSTVSPSPVKEYVARKAPQFMGWQQHDSQEFLAFLLDGLLEDTCTVGLGSGGRKPMTGEVVAAGRPEVEVAMEAWDNYMKRNAGKVADLFAGQFRSHVECNECGAEQLTYDPFISVSVPIPAPRPSVEFLVWSERNAVPRRLTCKDVPEGGKCSMLVDLVIKDAQMRSADAALANADLIRINGKAGPLPYVPTPQEVVLCLYGHAALGLAIQRIVGHDEPIRFRNVAYTAFICPGIRRTNDAVAASSAAAEGTSSVDSTGKRKRSPSMAPEGGRPVSKGSKVEGGPVQAPDTVNCDSQREQTLRLLGRVVKPHETVRYFDTILLSLPEMRSAAAAQGVPFSNAFVRDHILLQYLSRYCKPHASLEQLRQGVLIGWMPCADLLTKPATGPYADRAVGIPTAELRSLPEQRLGECAEYLVHGSDRDNAPFELTPGYVLVFEVPEKGVLETGQADKCTEVPTEGGGEVDIRDCLKRFSTREQLDEYNKFRCPKCKAEVQAYKSMSIWRTPELLILHLKRFSGRHGHISSKVDTFVDFPITGLDMSEFVLGPRAPGELEPIYDLYAVSEHSGGTGGGHYTATAKNFLDGRWYDLNDSYAAVTKASSAVSASAYLLFYRRRRADGSSQVAAPGSPSMNAGSSSTGSGTAAGAASTGTGNPASASVLLSLGHHSTGMGMGMGTASGGGDPEDIFIGAGSMLEDVLQEHAGSSTAASVVAPGQGLGMGLVGSGTSGRTAAAAGGSGGDVDSVNTGMGLAGLEDAAHDRKPALTGLAGYLPSASGQGLFAGNFGIGYGTTQQQQSSYSTGHTGLVAYGSNSGSSSRQSSLTPTSAWDAVKNDPGTINGTSGTGTGGQWRTAEDPERD